jgi:hypothetical protein
VLDRRHAVIGEEFGPCFVLEGFVGFLERAAAEEHAALAPRAAAALEALVAGSAGWGRNDANGVVGFQLGQDVYVLDGAPWTTLHELVHRAGINADRLNRFVAEGLTALLRHKLCCACAPARCACAAPVTAVTAMARAANPLALREVVSAMVRHGMWQRMRHMLAVTLETTREAERALDGVAESRVEAFANELSRGLCVGLRG